MVSRRFPRSDFNCSALAWSASRLTELRDTPTVCAISGRTSSYSRVETPRSIAPQRVASGSSASTPRCRSCDTASHRDQSFNWCVSLLRCVPCNRAVPSTSARCGSSRRSATAMPAAALRVGSMGVRWPRRAGRTEPTSPSGSGPPAAGSPITDGPAGCVPLVRCS